MLTIYYSSDSPSSLITESSVTQSLSSAAVRLYRRQLNGHFTHCALVRITVIALVTSNIIQSVCLVGKGWLKERCGLEPRTNCFFFV